MNSFLKSHNSETLAKLQLNAMVLTLKQKYAVTHVHHYITNVIEINYILNAILKHLLKIHPFNSINAFLWFISECFLLMLYWSYFCPMKTTPLHLLSVTWHKIISLAGMIPKFKKIPQSLESLPNWEFLRTFLKLLRFWWQI